MRSPLLSTFAVCLLALAPGSSHARAEAKPWPIKVVVVTTYEAGADTGDAPGEFQYWVEREHLDETLPFPGGVRPLRINATHDVLGIVTGVTLTNAGPSIMALGLDPRFDLSHAYFLVAGIAGVDPKVGSVGSAAWVRFITGDIAREIDSREIPATWPYGLFVLGAAEPNTMPAKTFTSNLHPLNAGLADWAYGLTKEMTLPETPAMLADHAAWAGYPAAMAPPVVFEGDSYSSDAFWHGTVMTRYAEDWVALWTREQGRFAMTDMEDAAFAEAVERLGRMGRVDPKRLMVLRVASNYSMQRPGQTAVESVRAGFMPSTALKNAWRVGSVVVHTLIGQWATYREHVPGE